MPTLDEIANEETVSASHEEVNIPEVQEVPETNSRANEMFSRIMTAETGEGSIGDYLEHPMNFNKSQGLAQILRGLTGIVGNLNLAIIDVVMGGLRFSKERKGVINNDVYGGGNFPT